jgi:lipopolysaccharide transport system ATP-binding protein
VAFAEVERFLDTPVKRYSSGMYVRLAFAVAAHLEPEILLVDEVLAVGDIQFQKKCLGKMEKVSKEGKTVIFVSHNMEAIQRLCNRAILLGNGKVVQDGSVQEVVNKYMQIGVNEVGERSWSDINRAPGDDMVRLCSVRLKNKDGKISTDFDVRDQILIEFEYEILKNASFVDAEVILYDKVGHIILYSIDNLDSPWSGKGRDTGRYKSTCYLPGDFLNEGIISVTVAVSTIPHTCHAVAKEIVCFEVRDAMDPRGVRGNTPGTWPSAVVRPRLNWEVQKIK